MTVVEVVGGPYDGVRVDIDDPSRPATFIVPPHAPEWDEVLEGAENLAERRVTLRPTLTRDGWRFYWREPE